MFPLIARGSSVIVKYIVVESEKVGAIVIPGQLDKEMIEAEIISVGPGLPDSPTKDLTAGERVLVRYRSFAGDPKMIQFRPLGIPVVRNRQTYHIHNQSEVLCKLVPGATRNSDIVN
jgi:co-chaperonin GroES (HSP10)